MAPAKKAAAKKSTAKKATAKKATAKKATAKKATAKKATKKATGKKATAKKATKRTNSAASVGNVVVASKVREAVKSQDVRMSSEFVEALNEHVSEVIAKAASRAKGNNRGTVRPGDL